MDILYLCNRKPCEEKCSYPTCKHTLNEEYAANPPEKRVFDLRVSDGQPYLVESE